MAIIDIFSKRGKPLPAKDVLAYDQLPERLRVQVVYIWTTTLGYANDSRYGDGVSEGTWTQVVTGLARELGVARLGPQSNAFEMAATFLTNPKTDISEALSLIELTFRFIDTYYRKEFWRFQSAVDDAQDADDAIAELNHRFLEHGVGYQYANGHLIRIDSTYQHSQLVVPALTLLSNPRFRNAQGEFLQAHKAYREGRYSDSLNESLKAFESTMKIICEAAKWPYQQHDTASKLISTILENGLISTASQQQLTSLRTLLESGTPTARNKNAAHGAGTNPVAVTEALALYGINTAAANITLLVSAFEALP